MNHKSWKLLFLLAASIAVILLGCSDEDGGGNPPPATPRVVGTWDADSTTLSDQGLDDFTY